MNFFREVGLTMSSERNLFHIPDPAAVDRVSFPWPTHTYGPPFKHLSPGLPDHAVMFREGE